jgi:hypothetical protein
MAAWLHGTKECLPSKHRRDRERKETADREHCREATPLSFSGADSKSVPPDQTFQLTRTGQSTFAARPMLYERLGDFSLIDANSLLPTASGCVLSGRRQQPVFPMLGRRQEATPRGLQRLHCTDLCALLPIEL